MTEKEKSPTGLYIAHCSKHGILTNNNHSFLSEFVVEHEVESHQKYCYAEVTIITHSKYLELVSEHLSFIHER